MDVEGANENLVAFKQAYPDLKVFEGSTIIHDGMDALLYATMDLLEVTPRFPLFNENTDETHVTYTFEPKEKEVEVFNLGNNQWRVESEKAIRLFKTVNFDTDEGVYGFAVMMKKLGVDHALREAGAKDGDLILIDEYRFEFVE